jgi:hypothetical protein
MVNILEQFSGSHIVLIDSWCLRDATLPGKAEVYLCVYSLFASAY